MLPVAGASLVRQLRRSTKADAQHRRKRSGAEALFLPAPVDKRCWLPALAHPQGANALRAVDLVCRYGDEVGPSWQLKAPERLHGVAQHERADLVGLCSNFRDGLDNADLVVHLHDGDECYPVIEFTFQQRPVEKAVGLHREHGQVGSLPRKPFAGVEHRRMLRRDRDDPIAPWGGLLDRPFKRPVERFGGTSGEGDAPALQAHRALNLLAGDFDRGFSLAAPARGGVRVGKLLLDPRLHRLRDFWRERGCRLVIEVDHAAAALARPAMRRHSAVNRSISASLVLGPKLTRITDAATSSGTPIAASTRLGFMLPDEQALPAETEMPARSSCTSWLALAAPGIA